MNRQDVVSGSLWLGVAIFVLIKALELGHGEFSNPGSGFVLFWSSAAFALLSLILIVKGSFGGGRRIRLLEGFRGVRWGHALLAVGAVILYTVVMPELGFLAATSFLMALLFWLGSPVFWRALLSGLITAVLAYGVFHYALQIEFPRGIAG